MNADVVQRRLEEQAASGSDGPPQWLSAACDPMPQRFLDPETSGKPDAGKLARPVWGWGRGETPGLHHATGGIAPSSVLSDLSSFLRVASSCSCCYWRQ